MKETRELDNLAGSATDSCMTSKLDEFQGCNRASSGDWVGAFHACMKESKGDDGRTSVVVARERVDRRGDGERRRTRLGSDVCVRAGVESELVCDDVLRSSAGHSHGSVNRSCAWACDTERPAA